MPRRGLCCECVSYHREKGQIPDVFSLSPAKKLMTGQSQISSNLFNRSVMIGF
jgi:hypothetical protein